MEWAGHHKAGHQGHHLNYFPQNRCCPNKRKSLENIEFSRLWWRKRWDSNPRALADNCISSAARYNHFDTLPCINIHFWGLITWFRVLHLRPLGQLSVSIFIRAFFQEIARKFVGEKTGETAKNIRFWDFLCWGISRRIRGTKFPASAEISSQGRYDHFDTYPYITSGAWPIAFN